MRAALFMSAAVAVLAAVCGGREVTGSGTSSELGVEDARETRIGFMAAEFVGSPG